MILLCLGTKVAAHVDHQQIGKFSIYHTNCEQLVEYDCKSTRCLSCTKHQKSLSAMVLWPHKDNGTDHSSYTTYSVLHTSEGKSVVKVCKKKTKD